MSDERYMLHLLVSRENGAQLVAIPLEVGIDESGLRNDVQIVIHRFSSSPDRDAQLTEALDAALRETSDKDLA